MERDKRAKFKFRLYENGTIRHFFAVYSVVFAVMALLVFYPFYHNGKTFIWIPDGWDEYYKALVYYGRYLRSVVRNLIENRTLSISAYSFHLGYGTDIFTTLHGICIGDPLLLAALFVPERYAHRLYDAVIILRLYLAGVSFSGFCFYGKKRKNIAVMAGALAYVFCGFAMLEMRHPFFLNPLIYFPLILLGVERILREKKAGLFTCIVCISAISHFYFFYMLTLLTVLYVAMRLVMLYRENRAEGYRLVFGRLFMIVSYSIIAVMLSAFTLLPLILRYLDGPRSGVKYAYHIVPTVDFLERLPSGYLSYGIVSTGGAVALLAVIALFLRKGHKELKIAFAVLTAFYCFPFFGHVLNRFSYSTDRWMWGYAMLLAFIVVAMWEELLTLSQKESIIMLSAACVYFALCMLLRRSVTKNMGYGIALVFVAVNFLFLYRHAEIKRNTAEMLLGGVIGAGIIGNAYFGYSMYEGNYIAQYADSENIYERLTDSFGNVIRDKDSGDTGMFYRVTNTLGDRNSMLLDGLSGTQYYWSLVDGDLFDFTAQLELLNNTVLNFSTLDKRAALNTLAGVKYIVNDPVSKTAERTVPYAYREIDGSDWGTEGKCRIYRNDLTLPLGYTYTSYILPESFDSLSPLGKQEAMLQGIYVEQAPAVCKEITPVSTSQEIDYILECNSG